MATRRLSVKFDTEGFNRAIQQLQSTGKAFDAVLRSSQEAIRRASEAQRQAAGAGDARGVADALRQQENAAKAAARAVAASYRELGIRSSESLNRLRAQAVAAFEAIKNSGTASARDIALAQEALNRRLRDLDNQLGGVQQTATSTGASFASLKLAVVGAVTAIAAGLNSLGREVITTGAKFEQFRVALNTFLGSRQQADRLIKQISDFAATTPFELPEIQKASQRLLAFGTTAEEIIPTLRRIGDVSAGVSAPIAEIAEIYGKARVANRLFADDINQLTGRGIPIITELAKQFGVAESEIRKLVENGKVNFSNLERAFVSLTSEGGKFFNLMQNQSETTGGQLSNLSDRFTALRLRIFEAFQPEINAAISAVSNNLSGLETAVNQVIGVFKFLIQNGNLVIAMLAGLATALAVTRLVAALTAAITALSSAMQTAGGMGALLRTAIAGISSPANLAATGIGILTAAIIKFSLDAKQAREDALNLSDALEALAQKSNNQALTELDRREATARSELSKVDADIARVQRQIGEFSRFERSGGNLSPVAPALRQELLQLQRQRADIVQGLQGVGATRARIQNNILDRQRYGPEVPAGFGRQQQRTTTPAASPTSATSRSRSQPKELTEEQKLIAEIVKMAGRLGINPEDLLRVMLFETGGTLSPRPHGNGAVGLIGFRSAAARDMGTTTAALGRMTAMQQLPFVERYLRMRSGGQRLDSFQKVAATIFGGNPNVPLSRGDGRINLQNYLRVADQRYGNRARQLISQANPALGDRLEFQQEQQAISQELLQQRAAAVQAAIADRRTQVDTWRTGEQRTLENEINQNRLEYEKAILAAEGDRKQILEDQLRLYNIEVEATIKQLGLTAELIKASDTITLIQSEKRQLTEEEQKQLQEAKLLQSEITAQIEDAKLATQRTLELEQERIRIQEEQLRQRLRGEVNTITDSVLSANAPAPLQQLNQQRAALEQQLTELLTLFEQAESLGDAQSMQRLQIAIDSLTRSREEALRIQIQELETAVKLRELKGEELTIFQQLNELQQEYDTRRLEIQTLIFQAIQDGNQEAIKTLEDLLERTDKLKLKQEEQIKSQFDFIRQLSDTVKQSAQQATEQALADLFTLSKGLGDIFRDFATSVLRSIAQLAAQQATKAIFKAIGLGFADGGLVRGPGTSRSDSIPARLSNGEFVMNADAVRYWGTGFMDSLNSMRSPSVAFAGAGASSAGFTRSPTVIMNVSTPDANSFRRSEGQIGRDAGEQLRRSVQRNG